ncbi:MAG: hypothetical protein ACR2NW_07115 [Thermodesulfobacteriota bacterium]
MMLYQRIKIKVFCLLMIIWFIGIFGVIVVGEGFVEAREVEKKQVPKDIKQQQQPTIYKGNLCNEGCVNLKVTESCIVGGGGVHYKEIEVCTREDTYLNTNYKCNKYTNFCFPFKCDQDGKFCENKCYTDHNCQPPSRCIETGSSKKCRVPTFTCNNEELSNGIETVSCHPYKCLLDPLPRCLGSCKSGGDCSKGYVCSAEGICVVFTK